MIRDSQVIVHTYISAEARAAYVKNYAHKLTPDRVVCAPKDALLHVLYASYDNVKTAGRPTLCIKNEFDSLVVVGFYDTEAEAEAARLQFINEYGIDRNREDFEI